LYQFLDVDLQQGVASIWLNRPQQRNALQPALMQELSNCFAACFTETQARLVVLGGRGPVFCAGADLAYMKEIASYSHKQNLQDAGSLAALFETINSCPCPIIACAQGAAIGGALGLLCCCDYVIGTSNCAFAFPEVRLGIAPATIAPYVISRIGAAQARALWLSGKRFNADYALHIGLLNELVEPGQLENARSRAISDFLQAGPDAARATKALIMQLRPPLAPDVQRLTAQLIADLRAGEEGQQGLAAALDKRHAPWQPAPPEKS
jgi:methylglutaconyl-CoA hydratase